MKFECIAVTGAAGLIGSAVVRQLNKAKVKVIAFDCANSQDTVPDSDIPLERVDLLDSRMIELLDKTQPQAVIHAAAHPGGKSLRDPVENVRVNALGSMQIFDWCAKSRSHVVFLSSSVVYGDSKEDCIQETASLIPGTVYGIAKVACEQWLRTLEQGFGLSWTVLRLFATYGSGHNPSLEQGIVNILLTQLLKGNQVVVKGSLKRRRDLIYVEDVATAITQVLFCLNSRGKIINVGSGHGVTIEEMIHLLSDTLNRPRHEVEIIEKPGTVGDPFSNIADISQLQNLLDFNPQFKLETGFQEMVAKRLKSLPKVKS